MSSSNKLKQNKSVYALAFATAVSFMGIGLVDPILPAISKKLNATPSQAMLLFTSYLIITSLAMFFTAFISNKLSINRTLLTGLLIVIICASLCSLSNSVGEIIGWRAFWGLGNALFISTALAAIVSSSVGGISNAIVLYEAAIGIGMAFGPLAGGILGQFSWRFPFAGTAILMLIGFIAILAYFKKPKTSNNIKNHSISVFDAIKALKNAKLRKISIIALLYNMVFFIVLAYSPFPLEHLAEVNGMHFGAIQLGLIFFIWGIFLAISSIWVTPKLTKKYGLRNMIKVAFIVLTFVLLLLAFLITNLYVLIVMIAASGFLFGILNTALTEAVMELSSIPKSIASSAYSGVRFLGGAISSALAGPIAAHTFMAMPYYIAAVITLIAILIILFRTKKNSIPEVEDLNKEDEASAIYYGAD